MYPARCIAELLQQSAFYSSLTDVQRDRISADLSYRELEVGAHACTRGLLAAHWIGVASGVIKIANVSRDGRPTTLTNFSAGCWFGEGSLLKGGAWPYDAVAVEGSAIALMPLATFDWLLASSFSFNRFLLDQLNARLGQFVERCEHIRLHDIDRHVAHCLAELVDPRFNPRVQGTIAMSQESLARLAGVSRSVVNRVLQQLERDGLVEVAYGSITLLDVDGLRRFSDE
ncbi:Crp/Fnr family transcriptional regulator [Xenophilus azovorans]|uniref:Crp/Fnr family transcriptional regulator n=1 Tax=Xenophilus azovorans TaxID=151755 RepID=UPI000570F621|nr:Crp/Fnr family transcriptional regulator [Xenophilus azovorans]